VVIACHVGRRSRRYRSRRYCDIRVVALRAESTCRGISQTYGVDFVDWDRFVIVSLVICTQSARVCCVCCSVDGDDMFALTSLVPWVSRSDVKRRASVLSLSLSLSLSCACDIVARAARQGTGVPLFHRGGP